VLSLGAVVPGVVGARPGTEDGMKIWTVAGIVALLFLVLFVVFPIIRNT